MTEPGRYAAVVVAVDGPSGSGKSSVARGVAKRLGLRYLDTGAMYRAITVWMLERGVDVSDPAAVAAVAGEPHLEAGLDPRRPGIKLDGRDVGRSVREPRVSAAVSVVSAVPEVRARLLVLQRAAVAGGGIVVEGRDIGTVVCPDATLKVFLTASAGARASRRHRQLARAGHAGKHEESTRVALERRDELDSTRAVSPLVRAPDAVAVDSTAMTLSQTIEQVVTLLDERLEAAGRQSATP